MSQHAHIHAFEIYQHTYTHKAELYAQHKYKHTHTNTHNTYQITLAEARGLALEYRSDTRALQRLAQRVGVNIAPETKKKKKLKFYKSK